MVTGVLRKATKIIDLVQTEYTGLVLLIDLLCKNSEKI
jgi:hypothetical protein